ncbi:MAG: CehA/McbA family metallohydrolase domain-containing protein, partial [Thermoguttaceae bacterium]
GRVWLAVRSPRLGTRVNVGNAWFEHLAFCDGEKWSGEIICPQTDNLLDNRPALVGLPSGQVVMLGATDCRFATGARLPQWFVRQMGKQGEKLDQKVSPSRWPDPVNNELMMAQVGPVAGSPATPVLVPAPAADDAAAGDDQATQEAAAIRLARSQRIELAGRPLQLVRGEFHRHTEISPDGAGDGLLMDMWRYALDAAGMDWLGNGDHDNGNGREYSWWTIQKTTSLFQVPSVFAPMYTYERSCSYPDGHRNVVFAQRGVRPLPRLNAGMGQILDNLPVDADRPNTPDTQMLYEYLRAFDGVCASHTSGTDMGTDWRDNDAKVEPIVEIYQGCRQNYEMPGAPRSNTAENSIGGWRPLGFVSLALQKGYRLGFQSSSDHGSTHISYCNVWAEKLTREAILDALKKRHVYGATDNIVADVRCGDHFMGDEFTLDERPRLEIRLVGTQPFDMVHVIKDGNYVHALSPDKQEVEFTWSDFDVKPGKTSYYYVRGEQKDGELVWVSPMWIKYQP